MRPAGGAAGARGIAFLRELLAPQPNKPDEVAITTTAEYQAFIDPELVWCWGLKVSPEEALLACQLMLAAMRAGVSIDWEMQALGYLQRARAQLGKDAPAPSAASAEPSEGEVCELLSEGQDPAQTTVSEPPATQDPREPPPEEFDIRHDDPGLPGNIGELIEEARTLSKKLEGQGEQEDRWAKELRELASEAAGLTISVGLVIGAYVVAAKFLGERIVFMWAWNASGVLFERHLARSLQPTAALEEKLRRLQQIKVSVAIAKAGSGVNWKIVGQQFSEGAIAQIDDLACGPACVDMALSDRGIPRPPQEMLARSSRVFDVKAETNGVQLARVLNQVDPAGNWKTDVFLESRDHYVRQYREIAERLSEHGSWIALVRDLPINGHWVLVEKVVDGVVSIRDPWPFLQSAPGRWDDAHRGSTGTVYEVKWVEFTKAWATKVAVYSTVKR